ncbi:unnamed protein product [Adineta ricciae]|uniref:Uncharacterized protein n=1 Tax=Adineta ricciae TaxID=249248 RepID=A0A815WW92_ADIRI|nr:unnamed protein product [Adineta ricciae]CAF1653074.1 unnamed protein product [Adineta ricciae]
MTRTKYGTRIRGLKYYQKLLEVFVLLTIIISISLYVASEVKDETSIAQFERVQSKVRVAIVNAVRYHGEVWYSYMYTARIRCEWQVSLFTNFLPLSYNNENGFSYLTRSWSRDLLSTPQQHVTYLINYHSMICSHSIIIICTIANSHLEDILYVLLNYCDKNRSFLILLQLHDVKVDIPILEQIFLNISSFRLQNRVNIRYLVLAEHMKYFARNYMTTHFKVDVWKPAFPLDLPEHMEDDQYQQYHDFIIQGKLDDTRRNYSYFAKNIKRYQHLLGQHKIVFTIIGVAETIDRHKYLKLPGVRLFLSSSYIPAYAFYSFIHQTIGIIPLYARDDYHINKQSSTIFCSILTQTPLLATQRLLDSHTFIPEEAVWLQYDNETEIDAAIRIVKSFSPPAAFRKVLFTKRQRLKDLLEGSYIYNEYLLKSYVEAVV